MPLKTIKKAYRRMLEKRVPQKVIKKIKEPVSGVKTKRKVGEQGYWEERHKRFRRLGK